MSFKTYKKIENLKELKQHLRGKINTLGYAIFYISSDNVCICERCFKKQRRAVLYAFVKDKISFCFDMEANYPYDFSRCEFCNGVLGEIDNNNEEEN